MTYPAVFKFINWITGMPVAIDDAMASALTAPISTTLLGLVRIHLTGPQLFYVTTGGNDTTGDGSIISPWATLTKAWKTLCTVYDISGFGVTINLGVGSFSGFSTFGDCSGVDSSLNNGYTPVGGGLVNIQGVSAASTKIITADISNFSCVDIEHNLVTTLAISDVTLDNSGLPFYSNMFLSGFMKMYLNRCNFIGQATLDTIITIGPVYITFQGSFTLSGNQNSFINTNGGGAVLLFFSGTTTVSGTPAWGTAMMILTACSAMSLFSRTFSGAATGKRYDATFNGAFNVAGGGPNVFPGNIAGTTSTGGQYA